MSRVPISLGVFETKVLQAVADLGDHAFCAEISRHLTAAEGRTIGQPQVVGALFRIAGRGLTVVSTVLPTEPRQGYRRRNVYRLTAAGKAALPVPDPS